MASWVVLDSGRTWVIQTNNESLMWQRPLALVVSPYHGWLGPRSALESLESLVKMSQIMVTFPLGVSYYCGVTDTTRCKPCIESQIPLTGAKRRKEG